MRPGGGDESVFTGGAIRDMITLSHPRSGFYVQGNALKLQKDLERAGAWW